VWIARGLSALLAVAGLTGLVLTGWTGWGRVSLPFAAGEAVASGGYQGHDRRSDD
jgi:hypothetical protein